MAAFITNSGWLDTNATDGFRKVIQKEFSNIYVADLRGSIRGRSGDSAKQEGQNIFDIVTGVAITILIKKPKHTGIATINYFDIGDYLNRKEKLHKIKKYKSIKNIDINW